MNKRIDEMYDASAGRQVLGSIIQKPELLSFFAKLWKTSPKSTKKRCTHPEGTFSLSECASLRSFSYLNELA